MADDAQPWLVEITIEPRSETDRDKLVIALAKLVAEDPSFAVVSNRESGRALLRGMDEHHLAAKRDILKRTYKVNAHIGAPAVAYRERLSGPVTIDHTHKTLTAGIGQFARLKIACARTRPGESYTFVSKISRDQVPDEFMRGIETGLRSALACGVVAGFPVVDLKVELIDAAAHEVDSSALALETAARDALRARLQRGGSVCSSRS